VSTRVPVLWQFRQSHYNEKARWALDWKRLRHVRRSLLPGLHVGRVMWMTRQKSVPVLVLDGRAIADSTRIIAAVEALRPDPPLYPAAPAERRRALELEEFMDEEVGPHVRRVFFFETLDQPDFLVNIFASDQGIVARGLYRALFPLTRMAMRLDMGITPEGAERSRSKVVTALDRIEAELRPSGYLVGDRFSVADLAAAALLSPLVWPAEYGYPMPSMPSRVASWCAPLAARPGFRWAAEMYRRHRGASERHRSRSTS
jgi:glutathione S-transferase